jgi:hypothetical protein
MGAPPSRGCDIHPWLQDIPFRARSDQGLDGGSEGRRVANGGSDEFQYFARQRTERTDNRIDARREREHASEPGIAKGGCSDVRVGFTAERSQCR